MRPCSYLAYSLYCVIGVIGIEPISFIPKQTHSHYATPPPWGVKVSILLAQAYETLQLPSLLPLYACNRTWTYKPYGDRFWICCVYLSAIQAYAPRRNRTFNLLLIKQMLYHLAIGFITIKKLLIKEKNYTKNFDPFPFFFLITAKPILTTILYKTIYI